MAEGNFDTGPWRARIAAAAADAGVELAGSALDALVEQARLVLEHNERLHLTTIVEPDSFVERHVYESLLGAAELPASIEGVMLDLGSGNGYPGVPLAAARHRLRPLLAESIGKKAAFLERICEALGRGEVVRAHVQRPADLDLDAPLRVVATRAMGGWEKIVPRLAKGMAPGGVVLLWAGPAVEEIRTRKAWNTLKLRARRAIRGRDRAALWIFDRL